MFWKKKNKKVDERKERSDKKVQVAPTVCVELKKEIERLAFITDQPVKYIGELLCHEGIYTIAVMERVARYFQRGTLRLEHMLFFGNSDNPSLKDVEFDEPTDRVYIRFPQQDFKNIKLLADLLDVNPSRATAELLDASIRHPHVIEAMLSKYNVRTDGRDVSADTRKLMKYVKTDNPYKRPRWASTIEDVADRLENLRSKRKMTRDQFEKTLDKESYKWEFD